MNPEPADRREPPEPNDADRALGLEVPEPAEPFVVEGPGASAFGQWRNVR